MEVGSAEGRGEVVAVGGEDMGEVGGDCVGGGEDKGDAREKVAFRTRRSTTSRNAVPHVVIENGRRLTTNLSSGNDRREETGIEIGSIGRMDPHGRAFLIQSG